MKLLFSLFSLLLITSCINNTNSEIAKVNLIYSNDIVSIIHPLDGENVYVDYLKIEKGIINSGGSFYVSNIKDIKEDLLSSAAIKGLEGKHLSSRKHKRIHPISGGYDIIVEGVDMYALEVSSTDETLTILLGEAQYSIIEEMHQSDFYCHFGSTIIIDSILYQLVNSISLESGHIH